MAWRNRFFSGLKFQICGLYITNEQRLNFSLKSLHLRRVFGDGRERQQLLIIPIGVTVNQIIKMWKDAWKYGQERWSGMITIAMA